MTLKTCWKYTKKHGMTPETARDLRKSNESQHNLSLRTARDYAAWLAKRDGIDLSGCGEGHVSFAWCNNQSRPVQVEYSKSVLTTVSISGKICQRYIPEHVVTIQIPNWDFVAQDVTEVHEPEISRTFVVAVENALDRISHEDRTSLAMKLKGAGSLAERIAYNILAKAA